MKNLSLLVISLFGLLAAAVSQTTTGFDRIFADLQGKKATPGVVVAVLKGDDVIYKRTFGFSNLEYNLPLDSISIFDMGSIAKQFTGFAVAKLILQSKLSLEDKISKFFPSLKLEEKELKVKHLVYQTSALRDVGDLYHLAQVGQHLTLTTAFEIIKRQRKLNAQCGFEFSYSNTNYVLLAMIVEKVTEMPFNDWCQENIFTPLGMQSTFVNSNPNTIIRHRATAYRFTPDGFSLEQNNGMALIGSSAVYSNLEDMIKWIRALQSENTFGQIFRLMKTEGTTDQRAPVGYGFGLASFEQQGTYRFGHAGATPAGFRSLVEWVPEEDLAVVLLSNNSNVNLHEFKDRMFEMLIAPKTGTQQEDEEFQMDFVDLSPKELHGFEGDFLVDYNQKVHIEVEDNKLVIIPDGHPKMDIHTLGPNRLWFPAFQAIIEFENKQFSEASIIHQGRRSARLIKIDEEDLEKIDLSIYVGTYFCDELNVYFDVKLSNEGNLLLSNRQHGVINMHRRTNKIFVPENPLASSVIFRNSSIDRKQTFVMNKANKFRDLTFTKLENGSS